MAFDTDYVARCKGPYGLPWAKMPAHGDLRKINERYFSPCSTVGWPADLVHNLMMVSLLASGVALLALWVSVAGPYAWGIYVAQGLLTYCRGSEGLRSFGITVRGVVLVPRLQKSFEVSVGYGFDARHLQSLVEWQLLVRASDCMVQHLQSHPLAD